MQDTAKPPARSLRQQLERLQLFQRVYNQERPHEALGNDTPAEHYVASSRRFDGVLREPEYDADHVVRRVRPNAEIRWKGKEIYIGAALVGEPVGIIEDENGDWKIIYGPITLGTVMRTGGRLRKPKPLRRGLVDSASALPTRSTALTTAASSLNKSGKVLPMSPV